MSEGYNGQISEETRKIAKDELREDESSRSQALVALRDWVEKNPKIKWSRTDDRYLLRFLRFKKFSVPMAQECLERYVLLRQTFFNNVFRSLDYKQAEVEFLLDSGYIFAAPGRDKFGRRWIINRPGVFDPHKFTNRDMIRVHGVVYETLMEDEENQVRGFVHFADCSGVTLPFLTLFTPKEAVRIVKNGEKTLPMRHKEVHVINFISSFKYVLDWGMTLMSEKIRKRVKIYATAEEAAKTLDVNMLPKEYGGNVPMSEMIASFKKELAEHRQTILDHDKIEMRLELFTDPAKEGAISALKAGATNESCAPYKMDVLTGSFRKLEVD
ncbi:CRAL_TRIO_N [Nesidiocoris tenuis]|uniref:CRAL_TRIO_N n=1 Tax=Nesidiocoris tenuis TaxID=355587 RepID=A0ABN7B616_9HEMI|nr:CRAL_TRIO_N [Nesidiocoris tenuis]